MDKSQLPKMLKKLHLYVLLLCALIGFGSYAQTYPVSISTQLSQPSPIYLSNYADATTINSPVKIQLALNDLTISNRQVRLKIYFQGNGISFSTNDFVVGARQLYLEGGFPLQLNNIDLAPYFEYQNLSGLNPNQYAQPLPEGVYNIYVEVYDFATGKKLSNKTAATTIIFQNEPPFLNLPPHNTSIMQQNIQNIIFSWTPRSINVSNVEYEFSLVEIWDKYTPIQNAFAYSPPLYTTTTKKTTLQYGISEPQLIPGKKYAWRIKAKAIFGAEEIGVFKNNGYSEIFSFDYEVFCTAPLAIKTTGVSENQAKIEWSGNIDNYDYEVKYREKNANSEWYKLVTPRETATLSNLKPKTTYEYTVGASCEVGKYTHSTVKEFSTLVRDEIAFQGCGIKPDPNDLNNQTPLPELFPNDVVSAGDFPIVVLKATGSNGRFTGEGYVTLPFLEKFRKLIDAADNLQDIANKGAEIIGKISTAANASANLVSNTADNVSNRLDNPTANSISNSTKNVQNKVGDIGTKVNEKAGDIAADIGKYSTNISEYTRVRITFNNIGVNTDFKLISGEIIASYDPNWGSIIDGDKLVENIINLVDEYDPIMESIFGPKPTKEERETANIPIDESDDIESENTNPSVEIPVEYHPIDIVEVDEPIIEPQQASTNKDSNATPSTTGIPTENGNYIEYQGEKYYNGGKINIPYARRMDPTFEMKIVPKDAIVSYSIYKPGESNMLRGYSGNTAKSTLPLEDNTIAYNVLKQDLLAEASSIEGNPKVKVLIEKVVTPFTQNKLNVIDVKYTKRIASAGKTLYFVNKPINSDYKEIKLEAILSQTDNNQIPKEYIKWKINDKENEYKEGYTEFTMPITDKIKNVTFTNSAGFPSMTDKTVSVKWVDEGKTDASFMPPAASYAVTNFNNKILIPFKGIATFLNDKLGTKLEAKIKPLKMKGEKYNDIDQKSRHYLKVLKGTINGGISIKYSDDDEPVIYPPFLKILNIAGISEVGLYLSPKIEFNLIGGRIKNTIGETDKVLKDQFFIEGNVKGCLELGLKTKLLVAKELVDFSVKGYGEGCMSGKVNYNVSTEQFVGGVYLDPIKLGVKAKIKTKDDYFKFTLVDIDKTWSITDKYKIYEYEN